MPSRKGKQVNIWIPTKLWQELDKRAKTLGMTRTSYITRTIEHEISTQFLTEVITGTAIEAQIDLEETLITLRKDLEQMIENKFKKIYAELTDHSHQRGQKKEEKGEETNNTAPPTEGRRTRRDDEHHPTKHVKKSIDKYIYTLNPKSRESVKKTYESLMELGGRATRKEIAENMSAPSENSIRRPLTRLIKDGWIKVEKEGRTFIYQCL